MANDPTKVNQPPTARKTAARTRMARGSGRTAPPNGTPTAEQAVARIATLFQAATAADQAEDLRLYKKDPELAAAMGIDPPQTPATDTDLQKVRRALAQVVTGTQLDQAVMLVAPLFAQQGSLTLNGITQQIQQELNPAASAKDAAGDAQTLLADSRDLALTALQFVMTRDASFDDLFSKLQAVLRGADPGLTGYTMDDLLDASEPIPNVPPPMRKSLQRLAELEAREMPPPSRGNGSGAKLPPTVPGGGSTAADAAIEAQVSKYVDTALLAPTEKEFETAWNELLAYLAEVHKAYPSANVGAIKHLHTSWKSHTERKKDYPAHIAEVKGHAMTTFKTSLQT